MSIVNQCNKKDVKVVGFATDCDSRYLRSMRLLMGFFADIPNQQIHLRDDAFCVDIPKVILILYGSTFSHATLFFLYSAVLELVLYEKSSTCRVLPG